jgi:hypothetical protein
MPKKERTYVKAVKEKGKEAEAVVEAPKHSAPMDKYLKAVHARHKDLPDGLEAAMAAKESKGAAKRLLREHLRKEALVAGKMGKLGSR